MKRFTKTAGAALAMVLLAGCTTDFYDSRMQGYAPEMPYQTYPIEVRKGTVNLRIPLVSGKLALKERTAVQRLAQDAVGLQTPIIITRPAGSVKGEVLAATITRELISQGVDKARIVHRTGGAAGEVQISYQRKFAVTRACGDWSKPVNETAMNRPYADFGCSQQHNIAAQVDNPEDFERPRVMTPPDADARNRGIDKYRKGEDTTSQWPGGSKIRIDDGVKSIVSQ